MDPAALSGVYEAVIYADDVRAAEQFYGDVLQLRAFAGLEDVGAGFRLPAGGVLLIFDPEQASRRGRRVPAHGAHGPGHVAFSVREGELDAWASRLIGRGHGIETEISWPRGGRSIYVRDPAGNSVELVEGEIWPL